MTARTKKTTDSVPSETTNQESEAEEKPGWQEYFFNDTETTVVTLNRITPEEWQGVRIRGYICDLYAGLNEAWIAQTHGGGRYVINLKDKTTGRILATTSIDVSGNPNLGNLQVPPYSIDRTESPELVGPNSPVNVSIAGMEVPFSGDLQEMQKWILFIKAVKSAFPDPPDYNQILLEALLASQRPQPDMVQTIKELKEAAELFGSTNQPGGNLYDVVRSGIEQAGGVLQNLTRQGMQRALAVPAGKKIPGLPTGKKAGLLGAPTRESSQDFPPETTRKDISGGLSIAPDNAGNPAETEQQKGETMSERDLILGIASQIVNAWRLNPPKEPGTVVRLIDQFLQVEPAPERQALAEKAGEFIRDFAEMQLSEDWLDAETLVGNREEFTLWFDKIIELYQSPERGVALL